jgi:hypothetical protein
MRKIWILPFCAGLAVVVLFYPAWQYWISHGTGSYNTPGTAHNYNFYSGFGSDIIPAFLTILGLGIGFWWHNQCHVGGCFWYARRTTAAGDRACFIHHPEGALTKVVLHARHHAARSDSDKLDEIHRHVSSMSPDAGNFSPPNGGEDGR